MVTKSKKKKVDFNIIFDTSALVSDSDAIVCSEFENLIQDFSKKGKLKIYIPAVVKGELYYQEVSKAKKNLEKANGALATVGNIIKRRRKTPYSLDELQDLFDKRFIAWEKKWKVNIIDTPQKKISLNKLIEDSIWRNATFEDVRKTGEFCKKCRAEKGFRDAIILNTMIEYTKTKPQNKFYFVISDKNFRNAAKENCRNKKIQIFETIENLSSHIRLALEKEDEKWISRISEKVNKKFFQEYWRRLRIIDKIEEKYIEHFVPPTEEEIFPSTFYPFSHPDIVHLTPSPIYNPASSQLYSSFSSEKKSYVPIDEGVYKIYLPNFQKIKDTNIFIWKSKLFQERKYKESSSVNVFPFERIYRIHFEITWSVKVASNLSFSDPKLLDIKFIKKGFEII